MKNSSSTGSRRRYRRGPRRQNDQDPETFRNNRGSRPPKKPASLWERFLAFFQVSGKASGSDSRIRAAGSSTEENGYNRQSDGGNSRNQSNGRSENRSENRNDSRSEERKTRVARKPEHVEVTSARLYVGNLSFDATESDLNELFNGVGQVQSAEIVSHRHTQRSKGFAFVQMNSLDEAKRAVVELHDKEFLGRKLVVSGAKSPDGASDSDSSAD